MKDITVLLLSGGQSNRFWPLGQKNLLPIFGKNLVLHQIHALQDAGFSNIVAVVNEKTHDCLQTANVTTVIQKGEGMAHAILSAKEYITGRKVLIVIDNDFLHKDFFKQVRNEIQKTTNNMLVTYQAPHYLPMGYVSLHNNVITDIVEKPKIGQEPSSFVTISSHFFQNADTLLTSITKTKSADDDRYEKAIKQMMKNGDIFEQYIYDGPYAYLKYPWHMLQVMSHFLSTLTTSHIAKNTHIDKTARVIGPVVIEEGVRVMEYAKISGPSYIGRNTIIGNHTMIRNSHIGEQCVIGFGSDITRSYIGALTWLHSNYVGDSILGESVTVGSGTVFANLRLDEQHIHSPIRKEKISTMRDKLGAIIADMVSIGVNCSIMPGVKIGTGSIIGAGVILQEDLADNTRCYIQQHHTKRTQTKQLSRKKRNAFREKL